MKYVPLRVSVKQVVYCKSVPVCVVMDLYVGLRVNVNGRDVMQVCNKYFVMFGKIMKLFTSL